MAQGFTNKQMMDWLAFFSDREGLVIENVRLMNICDKMKNVLPSVETNRHVLLFVNETQKNVCYDIWESGHGNLRVLIGKGPDVNDEIEEKIIMEMIDDEIKGPTVLLIENESAHESYKIGIKNENFSRGPIHYVGHEIRAVIMSMLEVNTDDVICIVTGESIVIESAMMAYNGTIIAVETDPGSKASMAENVDKFGVHNVAIVDNVDINSMKNLPIPRLAFIVATDALEQQVKDLRKINPKMQFIVYTLELDILSGIKEMFKRNGIKLDEVIQITVAKTNKSSMFVTQPSPWMISGTPE
ncbi:MAG: Precorrin-6B methylase 2 [Eubacterium sp.]|nr:Precorrin-6B methylase 2 [Eubacterium sp.]